MKNIILIGMPCSGKTTIGSELTNAMHFKFLDTDQLLKNKYQTLIPLLIEEVGVEKFKEMENEIYLSLNETNAVISTGGSVVYFDEVMNHLKENGIIVYLSLPYEDIEKRLAQDTGRKLVTKGDQTLLDAYNERIPLYTKWSDITIYCENRHVSDVVDEIISKIEEFNKENN